MRHKNRVLLIIAAALLPACALPTSLLEVFAPAPAPLDEETFNRYVAETAAAAATQTSLAAPSPYQSPTLVPTFTPIVTTTPSPVPSPTVTFIWVVASPTRPKPTATRVPTKAPSSGGSGSTSGYACQFIAQDPDNGKVFAPNADFDARWRVKNTGTKTWDQNSADYLYKSGDKFYQQIAYDFPKTVKPGNSVDLIVDMRAPSAPGEYTTRWEIRIGQNHFCTMRLTIEVS